MSSNAVSRKRSAVGGPEEEGIECGSLAKKIKNIHLSQHLALNGSLIENHHQGSLNDDSGSSSSEPFNHSTCQSESDDNVQKLLSDQVVNYGNQIIESNYSPALGPKENAEYFETNRVLFEANKMRLLRAQMKLLEQAK